MTDVEKKGIGIAKIGLVVCAVLVVVLAVSNVWSYTHLQNQIDTLNEDKTSLQSQVDTLTSDKNSLQNQVSSLQSQVNSLTTDNNNLQNEVNSLKAPQLHEVNVEWSDHHPWFTSPYISISGAIFNSGTNSASNVTLTVKIYDSADILLRSKELIFGSIDGKSYKNFDTHIGYSGDADHITTTLAHD